MNTIAKTLLLTAAAAALSLSAVSEASADSWRHRHHGNDAWVGGAVGLATGLVVGSAIANANQPRYYYDEPRYAEPRYAEPVYEPEYEAVPVYRAPQRYYAPVRAGLEPWTPQWQRYCSYRYRSFDPGTGTFIGNDGRQHFCTAG
jgi:hypothetical protein